MKVNLLTQEPVLSIGEEFSVEIPPGYCPYFYCATVDIQVRTHPGGAGYILVPKGVPMAFGRSQGQTLYVTAANGATVYWAVT